MAEQTRICAIGGLDATGGAGLLADAEAIRAAGAVPCCVATAVTAQFGDGRADIELMGVEILKAQWHTITRVGVPEAIKIGMLGSVQAIDFTRSIAQKFDGPIILDPVFKATSGAPLLPPEAITHLTTKLLPLVTLTTPNLAEGAHLLDLAQAKEADEMYHQVALLHQQFASSVLLKGGHLSAGDRVDVLYDAQTGRYHDFCAPWINAAQSRGTGCRLASFIAAQMGNGVELHAAMKAAKAFVQSYLTVSRI